MGNLFTSAQESAKRWAGINQCSFNPRVGNAFDLITILEGKETIPNIYSCPSASVELWTVEDGSHGPILDSSFALQVMDWLLAHPKG